MSDGLSDYLNTIGQSYTTLMTGKRVYVGSYDGEPLEGHVVASDAEEAYKMFCESLDGIDYYDPKLVYVHEDVDGKVYD